MAYAFFSRLRAISLSVFTVRLGIISQVNADCRNRGIKTLPNSVLSSCSRKQACLSIESAGVRKSERETSEWVIDRQLTSANKTAGPSSPIARREDQHEGEGRERSMMRKIWRERRTIISTLVMCTNASFFLSLSSAPIFCSCKTLFVRPFD